MSVVLPAGPFTRLSVIPVAAIFSLPVHAAAAIVMLVQEALTVIVLVSVVSRWEGLPLRSMGVGFPQAADVPYAIATAAASVFLSAVLELHFLRTAPAPRIAATERGVAALAALPLWLRVAQAFGNGMAEEIGARGYVMEHIISSTGMPFLALGVSSLASTMMHIPAWGPYYALAVLPAEAAFAVLYLFRRNIWPCVAAHFLSDSFAVIIWPVLPGGLQIAFWRAISAL